MLIYHAHITEVCVNKKYIVNNNVNKNTIIFDLEM